MKRTNRLFALFLSLIMILFFAGCNLDTYDYTDSSTGQSTISTDKDLTTNPDLDSQIQSKQSSAVESTDKKDSSSVIEKPSGTTSVGTGTAKAVDPSTLPAYSGSAYTVVNGNQPNFSASELTTVGYEKYANLDRLGRCGLALASCGKEIMPADGEERGSISSIKPTGWVQAKYDGISGGYLWNRCHLIGWSSQPKMKIDRI